MNDDAARYRRYAKACLDEAEGATRAEDYYTSADTAMRILRNGEIWMRKSHLMNDFREIEHGFECLRGEYSKSKPSMDALFDGMFPGFCERLEKLLERPFRVYRPFGVHPPNEMARPSLPSAVGAMQRCGVMRCNETAACCIASRESRAPLGNIGMHSPFADA
ncbi:hypothetical protein [Bradyrhizobium sp. 195]|uniref:hypothetical protein n=1 Tax=Bradyrhizobium sp. 195 TaxID=2782662 RepID=UPI0020019FEF|nr:hypothetical protein [Bradyrhizobium sp. 195]UPK31245.1 hypothetical protein IVB26_39585 [Bradyrhizobium sp. 195]